MRLIDADLMIVNGFENKTIEVRTEDIIEKHEVVVKLLFKDALEFIKKQPTVDAVKVIRCKDCKHWDDVSITEKGHECNLTNGNKYKIRIATPSDWFCPMGERRSE